MKNVLILGAGLVARPMVKHLLDHDIDVTVASRTKSKGDAMMARYEKGRTVAWTVDQDEELDKMVKEHDLVVSLLPFAFHPQVAEKCIAHRKPMVTTSYVKPEMQALNQQARDAGIILLNEIGVDPGIDHMSAMRIIDHIHNKGGRVEAFYSITGALVAPEGASDNPFGYKFSWSPKGVVKASKNPAKFLKEGIERTIPGKDLFKKTFYEEYPGLGTMEIYANRNSINYIDQYGIPEVSTMFRGTFRHKGWCESVDALKELGLLNEEKQNMSGMTYAGMTAGLFGGTADESLKQQVADYLGVETDATAVLAVEWLGLLRDEPMNRRRESPFDVTTDLMIERMMIAEDEREMVAMQHTFLAAYHDKKEVIKSRLLTFGTMNTETSIARTVSLPAAVAVRMILNGKITLTGVYQPVVPEIYNPVLDELEHLDIKMEEEFGLPEDENIHFNL